MPLFFFHYYTADQTTRDDVGCRFESLELAYIDAYRSMIEIGAELLKGQVDPANHRIDIADGAGQVLMELRFAEVFRRRQGPKTALLRQAEALKERRRDFRRLRDENVQLRNEMQEVYLSARLAIAQAREMVQRARAVA